MKIKLQSVATTVAATAAATQAATVAQSHSGASPIIILVNMRRRRR